MIAPESRTPANQGIFLPNDAAPVVARVLYDIFLPSEYLKVEQIAGHQLECGCGGVIVACTRTIKSDSSASLLTQNCTLNTQGATPSFASPALRHNADRQTNSANTSAHRRCATGTISITSSIIPRAFHRSRPDPRVRSGGFQNLTGRVGPGRVKRF